jgi:CheY-like chemotaxis protein
MPVKDLVLPAVSDQRAVAHPELPLQGLTILAVEDSRFACEALRLMCLRLGARLRRAETLELAAKHLAVYRPDVVIVDLGLPDGDGADLIRALSVPNGPCVVGTSGNPDGRGDAMAAGASGFLEKPTEDLDEFQSLLLSVLHGEPKSAPAPHHDAIRPDRLALRDDLVLAEGLLARSKDGSAQRYAAGFLGSVAQSSRDAVLARVAGRATETANNFAELQALVRERLSCQSVAFPDKSGRVV